MGRDRHKKKREAREQQQHAEEVEEKAVCFYCMKECANEQVLILHQKAVHFRCLECNKKVSGITGLKIHCTTVHRTPLEAIPGSIEGRDDVNIEVYGMAGVPEEFLPESSRKRMRVEQWGDGGWAPPGVMPLPPHMPPHMLGAHGLVQIPPGRGPMGPPIMGIPGHLAAKAALAKDASVPRPPAAVPVSDTSSKKRGAMQPSDKKEVTEEREPAQSVPKAAPAAGSSASASASAPPQAEERGIDRNTSSFLKPKAITISIKSFRGENEEGEEG